MSTQFDNVSLVAKANVYFDGKCVSYGMVFGDGSKKTVGVIFPSSLTFSTGAAEIMELNAGKCRIRLRGEEEWKTYVGGERFEVPGNSSFDIETLEMLDYVCHFALAGSAIAEVEAARTRFGRPAVALDPER